MPALLPDGDFVNLFEALGAKQMSERLNVSERSIYRRRENLEKKLGRQITAPSQDGRSTRFQVQHPHRIELDVKTGVVLVGSDAHFWPGSASTAWAAFVKFAEKLNPAAVILNGDVLDFPQISRHSPIGWENHPTVEDEIEYAQERLAELESLEGRLIWTLGNHDGRFETRLATIAPEYAKIAGVHLKDHFPHWEPCWSVWVNGDVVIKHRWKGGIHATHNNALGSGKTMVTGHLHSAKVTPYTDYNGTRYGVDTGCLADPSHRAFVDYTEDNPKNWISAFAVLTFHEGKLMMPELVTVWDQEHVQFRGDLYRVLP